MAQKKNAPAIQKNNQSAQANKRIVAIAKHCANSVLVPAHRIIRCDPEISDSPSATFMVRQTPGPRQQIFGPDYYRAIERITPTRYQGHLNGTPLLYAAFTAKWVYEFILPDGMYSALKNRGGWHKVYQWLDEGGLALLRRHIQLVCDTANRSVDLSDFKARMMQMTNKRGQLSFVFTVAK